MSKVDRVIFDLFILVLLPASAMALSFLLPFNFDFFDSLLLFYVPPVLYLSIKGRQYTKRAIFFSAAFSIPTFIFIDYIAEATGAWFVQSTIFPFKLFDLVTIEVLLWAFLSFNFVIMFYEYFLDRHITKKLWHPHMKYLLVLLGGLLTIFVVLFSLNKNLLFIPYFYLLIGLIGITIPLALELFFHPRIGGKLFYLGAYFFYFSLIYEITGLKKGWWEFASSTYAGSVSLLNITFPLEELIFFMLLFAMAIASYYEFFYDDNK